MKSNTVTIEIDGSGNQNAYFRPLMKKIRGKFDLHRCREPNAGKLHSLWPTPIPGQQISLDLVTAEGAIVDPLYESQFQAIRERIESQGMKLPPEKEVFQGVDVVTWTHHLKGMVDTGLARIVSGEFPSKIEGTPKTRFHSTAAVEPLDKLTATIDRQNELLTQLVDALTQKQ